ncbi:hypothetical protein PanWU01x14_001650, partial [Parasponia andersonii]
AVAKAAVAAATWTVSAGDWIVILVKIVTMQRWWYYAPKAWNEHSAIMVNQPLGMFFVNILGVVWDTASRNSFVGYGKKETEEEKERQERRVLGFVGHFFSKKY